MPECTHALTGSTQGKELPMSKLILALATLATLSAPAAAGGLDVDLHAADGAAQIGQPVQSGNASGSTRSMTIVEEGQSAAEISAERNKRLFGANSR
jgi:hypothetical protein